MRRFAAPESYDAPPLKCLPPERRIFSATSANGRAPSLRAVAPGMAAAPDAAI